MRSIVLLAFGLIAAIHTHADAKPPRADKPSNESQRHADTTSRGEDFVPPALIKRDEELYTRGSYSAYAAPWSAKGSKLVAGRDFVDTIAIHESTFPAQTRFAWHWPLDVSKKTGVRGYNALSYGNYDGGVPERPVRPVRVRDMGANWQRFDWRYDLVAGDFNLLAEFYLTRTAGNPNDKALEVGFMLHTPAMTLGWIGKNPPLARWRDAFGIDWTVTRNEGPGIPYIILVPTDGRDLREGKLDVTGALRELRRLRLVTGDEWLNGVAIGAEPISGSGSVTMMNWEVHW